MLGIPIDLDAVLASATNPMYPRGHGLVVWLEARPAEKGRQVIVAQLPDGTSANCCRQSTVPAASCWSTAAALLVGGRVAHLGERRRSKPLCAEFLTETTPSCLTCGGNRFGDVLWDAKRARLIAVMETPSAGLSQLSLVSIELAQERQTPGYCSAAPTFTPTLPLPCGDKLAFIQWQQGHMPWGRHRTAAR